VPWIPKPEKRGDVFDWEGGSQVSIGPKVERKDLEARARVEAAWRKGKGTAWLLARRTTWREEEWRGRKTPVSETDVRDCQMVSACAGVLESAAVPPSPGITNVLKNHRGMQKKKVGIA